MRRYDGRRSIGAREVGVVNAIVLLRVQRDRLTQVAEDLVAINGISEVYAVAGQFDLVAILRAADDEQFAEAVTVGMLEVDGIRSSETLIALRTFSRFDLETMFDATRLAGE
jgi:DNA-binding Lrp family transcriptional regulator